MYVSVTSVSKCSSSYDMCESSVLMKVAEAATVKLPTWKSSTALSVKQVKAHIKSYAAAKRSTWNTRASDEQWAQYARNISANTEKMKLIIANTETSINKRYQM